MTLAHDDRAPTRARRASRDVLVKWQLPDLVDIVLLAVSELVTNAVLHGRPVVWLELSRSASSVRVGVHDEDPTEPTGLVQGGLGQPDAESGRGLDIVRALATEVGIDQIPDDGKVVYARFARADERND